MGQGSRLPKHNKNLYAKRLLILGSTAMALEIVKAAKKLGVYTVVTDWTPFDKAPAKRAADRYYDVSIADIDALLDIVKSEKIDGVLAGFSDFHLKYYVEICDAAGLWCYGTKEQFETLTNKAIYKALCRKYNVPTIPEYDAHELMSGARTDAQFPLLVKPVDNAGARGISVCRDMSELREAYSRALEFSQSKKVLVERYIEGDEATAFFVINDGEVHFIGLADRLLENGSQGYIRLPYAYSFPSVYTESYCKNERLRMQQMLAGIGLKNGMLFAQYLVDDGVLRVYDIGYRLTNSLEFKLTDYCAGYSHLDMLIRFALTGKMWDDDFDESRIDYKKLVNAYNLTLTVRPGTIGSVEGVDALKQVEGVIDAVATYTAGDVIKPEFEHTLLQVELRVLCHADSDEELLRIVDAVDRLCIVKDTNGAQMLSPTRVPTRMAVRI